MNVEAWAKQVYSTLFRTTSGSVSVRLPDLPEPDNERIVQILSVGRLQVVTGALIACDPSYADFPDFPEVCRPFAVHFPLGAYPVLLALGPSATFYAALVRFSDREPVRWEQALRTGEDPSKLTSDEYYCFGVDSGMACLMDAAALEPWHQQLVADNKLFYEPKGYMIERADQVDRGEWREVVMEDTEGRQANLFLFTSGEGDGCYPCCLGYDEQNVLCGLLTIFVGY